MKKVWSGFLMLFFLLPLGAQDNPAYQIYNKSGKKVKYGDMIDDLAKAEILLFGELHYDPIVHWLQLEVSQDMIEKRNGQVILGAEMFEADNQLQIDEYFSGAITEKYFEDETRLWENYSTDYKPLVLLAKEKQLPFIATNIPRRYANMVYKKGLESLQTLSETAKSYIAPLPIEVDLELSHYKEMMEMMGGHEGAAANFPNAQAVKDATMAWFISQNLKADHLFIHFNGAFHSDNEEGIGWYLRKEYKQKKVLTITMVYQSDISKLEEENKQKADFILCIPENMCKTH